MGFNLKSCQYCFACCNLKNAKYCIENKQYTREECEKKIIELSQDLNRSGIGFEQLKKQAIRKYINGLNLENCSGDALFNSKNAQDSL